MTDKNRGKRPYLRLVDETYRTPPPKHVRLQFDFTHDAYQRLCEIRSLSGHESSAELIRDALRIYEWLYEARRPGESLLFPSPNKVFEIQLSQRTERLFARRR